jgi:hypothetical protein
VVVKSGSNTSQFNYIASPELLLSARHFAAVYRDPGFPSGRSAFGAASKSGVDLVSAYQCSCLHCHMGLLNCAADIREHIACVRTQEANRSDCNCQNDREHDRVLGNILCFVPFPQPTKKARHSAPPFPHGSV